MAFILVVLGMLLIGIRAFGVVPPRVHLGWLGLALVVLGAFVVPGV